MEFPWNSTGMAHSYHSCRFPVEFQHSMGFRRNLPELMEEGKVLLQEVMSHPPRPSSPPSSIALDQSWHAQHAGTLQISPSSHLTPLSSCPLHVPPPLSTGPSTLLCPPYSCQSPVIPVESGGIWWSPVEWDRNPLESTGIHWTPLESTGFWSHKTIIQNKSVYSSPFIPI